MAVEDIAGKVAGKAAEKAPSWVERKSQGYHARRRTRHSSS